MLKQCTNPECGRVVEESQGIDMDGFYCDECNEAIWERVNEPKIIKRKGDDDL